jgi:beta-galactosidase
MLKYAAGMAAAILIAAGTFITAAPAIQAETAPAAARGATRITDVFVRTSVRERRAHIDIEVTGARNAGLVNLTARMLNEAGQEEIVFVRTARIEAKDVQVVTVTLAWRDPRVWDLGQPNLYTLKLKAAGAGIDQEVTQEFGFREFWIDGRDFYLNGTKLHFRPTTLDPHGGDAAEIAKEIDHQADLGFNLGELKPTDDDFSALNDAAGRAADRKGFAVAGVIPYINKVDKLDDPKQRAAYEEKLAQFIRKARNHPSILFWGTSTGVYANGRNLDPRLIGQRSWAIDREAVTTYQRGLEVLRIVRENDPTRPTFTHGGGYVGDVYTTSCGLGFLPLQERDDWLSAWADTGKMPLMMFDFSAPGITSYFGARMSTSSATPVMEPLATERAAAYLGGEAYRKETPAYRAAVANQIGVNKDVPDPLLRQLYEVAKSPAVVDTQRLFITNMWRAWRTWGISGGMAPAGVDVYLPDDLLKACNAPAMAWIAGSARDGFTSKDHSFRTGDRVAKQIVLINDLRKEQPFTISWTASVGATEVEKRT